MEFHIHVHNHPDKQVVELLKEISKQNIKMAKKIDDLLAKQDQIDATIEEVKKDLDFIKAQLGAGSEGGLTAEETQALEARVDATLERLGALDAETDSTPPTP